MRRKVKKKHRRQKETVIPPLKELRLAQRVGLKVNGRTFRRHLKTLLSDNAITIFFEPRNPDFPHRKQRIIVIRNRGLVELEFRHSIEQPEFEKGRRRKSTKTPIICTKPPIFTKPFKYQYHCTLKVHCNFQKVNGCSWDGLCNNQIPLTFVHKDSCGTDADVVERRKIGEVHLDGCRSCCR